MNISKCLTCTFRTEGCNTALTEVRERMQKSIIDLQKRQQEVDRLNAIYYKLSLPESFDGK